MRTVFFLFALFSMPMAGLAESWPLNEVTDSLTVRGSTRIATGASEKSLMLNGDSLIELNNSAKLASGAFTVSLWFNPYNLAGDQQMLAGKNRYSRNERQWSLTIEPNGKLKAFLWENGWRTISCPQPLKAGAWHLATLVVSQDKATLFLNGKPGESAFSEVFLIRTSISDKTPGVSARNADFSYPYAVEHEGKLYIGYTHKSHMANELAIIPIRSLKIIL